MVRIFSNPQFVCLQAFCPFTNHNLQNTSLPQNEPKDDEVNVLARQHNTTPATVQTMTFTNLPAELRNRIYEHTLPSAKDQLLVATPFRDDFMSFGDQPAITKVSKQVRSETLPMFYTNSTFVAYIQYFYFKTLVRWAKCITSTASSAKVTVEVKLLDRIECAYELLDLVRAWRDIDHQNVRLRIHNCYTDGIGVVFRIPGLDQRALVAKAVMIAEKLRQQGDTSEGKLVTECYEHLEDTDRRHLCGIARGIRGCAFEAMSSTILLDYAGPCSPLLVSSWRKRLGSL